MEPGTEVKTGKVRPEQEKMVDDMGEGQVKLEPEDSGIGPDDSLVPESRPCPSPSHVRRSSLVYITNYEGDPNRAGKRNIFDTHCHLDRLLFDPSVLKRAKLPEEKLRILESREQRPIQFLKSCWPDTFGDKFEGCLSVCCDPEFWHLPERFDYLSGEDEVYLAFGCHPSKAHLYDEAAEENLKRRLNHEKVRALGEIGLDSTYFWSLAKEEVQKRVFRRQLKIARELCLPLVVHLRGQVIKDAHDIMKEVLGDEGKTIGIHLHCFNYSYTVAEKFLQDFPRMKFGLTPNHYEISVGLNLPLKHILIETDSPYFIPKQLKRTHPIATPGMAFHVAAQLAELRRMPLDEVLEATRANVDDIYGISMAQDLPAKKEDDGWIVTRPQLNKTDAKEEDAGGPHFPLAVCNEFIHNHLDSGGGSSSSLSKKERMLEARSKSKAVNHPMRQIESTIEKKEELLIHMMYPAPDRIDATEVCG